MAGNTYKVCLQMTELRKRDSDIVKVLSPLVERPESLYVIPRTVNREEFVFVAVPKGTNAQGDYTDKKFRTVSPELYATYHERWFRFYEEKEEFWYLERAYLHFYQIDRPSRSSSEFLLLHCDPNETREHALYKQSPHLHIVTAPDPWPHAHIALNVGYLEPMLKDASSLTRTFGAMVVMIKEQILDNV